MQGCRRHCPGCVAPEMQPFEGGFEISVDELADLFLNASNLEGITFSGGEPMEQAEALAELILKTREKKDFSFFCFTGFLLEDLIQSGTPAQKQLVSLLDVLVDGPFVEEEYANLLWRGSANQRVHFLSDRYKDWADRLSEPSQGLELEFDSGMLKWMGIPPLGFREKFASKMAEFDIIIEKRSL
ncbi:MAG: radical SAM protein [Thermoguttaceae bacterium]|nr:radical SAM protein [Thermoguttaceae bacterium]